MRRIVIAVTGATGSIYAVRLVQRLLKNKDIELHLVISSWGEEVMKRETGVSSSEWIDSLGSERVFCHAHSDLAAPISSGSFRFESMVIIPCSMGTLSAVASGLASNLIERSASVALKERRRLILVARESPLSAIHLNQMLTLTHAGAMILPPVPAFYNRPETIEDVIDTTVERVLDALSIEDMNITRWRDE